MAEETVKKENGAVPEKPGNTPSRDTNAARHGGRRYIPRGGQRPKNGTAPREGQHTSPAADTREGVKPRGGGNRRGGRTAPRRAGSDTQVSLGNAEAGAAVTRVTETGTQAARERRTGGRQRRAGGSETPLRVISLGGLGEIGKNMTVLEW